ncbi:YybH family protein [Patiriisocius sp. Uisw_017]|jgi:ketosteroid isomerase-like protein|uniref:YybH family protein n=1 Tax=Patiriisocius sp. Uisw_017 TaxID=3230968 RepID=UPI0039E8C754
MIKNIKLFGFLIFTAFVFTACDFVFTAGETLEKEEVLDMEKVKIEIQAMEDAFAAGEKAKDADAVAAYYSDDAMSYSRNREPLSGKKAIRDNIANGIAKDTTGNYNVYKIVDLYAEGDTAVEIGSWTEFDASGNEKDNGNYMSFFQKRDGTYICVRDMSTTTSPVKSGI